MLLFATVALTISLPVSAIDIQRWVTSNGTQILLVERHQIPIVDYAVIFKGAGSIAEPEGKSDIASPVAQMIMRGTQQLNEEAFNEKINDLGSEVFGNSGFEYSVFNFRSLSEPKTLEQTSQLFSQAIYQPRFDKEVLQRLQNQTIVALKQAESSPTFLTAREQARLNYPNHPYGKSAKRTEESIRAVNIADLRQFHHDYYAQSNAIVTIVGDINRQDAEQLVQQTLGQLPIHPNKQVSTPPVTIHSKQVSHIPLSDSKQTSISIGLPVLKIDDPDYFPMLVGNYILGGGGFDSRLMRILRDQYGYTYGVSSNITAYEQAGPFNISFSTENKNSQVALKLAQKVLEEFVKQGPTIEELKQAKSNITGSFPLRFDSNRKLLSTLLNIGLYNRPDDWLDSYNDKINAVTIKDIQRAWQKHIKPKEMNIVITGNKSHK